MADSPSLHSSSTSASQSTKQLLDELDSLMQRMLAVPVQPADVETAPPPSPAPRQVELKPAPITPVVQAPPSLMQTPPAPHSPVASEPFPPLVPIIVKRPKGVAAEMQVISAPPAPVPRQQEPVAAQPPQNPKSPWMNPTAPKASPRPAVPGWGSRILLAMNRSYDRGTDRLGPLGRWLRGEMGRSLLGWIGLAMLVVALAWAAVLFLG
jgi:hypothetical protein